MLVVRTIESPTNSVSEFVSSQQSIGLYDPALAVYPLGLYGVKPRTLLGQKAAYDPHPLAALLDLAVVSSQPAPELSLEMCQLALSQMRTTTFLPRASSFSEHHERNRVVMELTGRPSTNLIHVSSSSGR
jgi:hypothetical protein